MFVGFLLPKIEKEDIICKKSEGSHFQFWCARTETLVLFSHIALRSIDTGLITVLWLTCFLVLVLNPKVIFQGDLLNFVKSSEKSGFQPKPINT